jgi:hypothetical protein
MFNELCELSELDDEEKHEECGEEEEGIDPENKQTVVSSSIPQTLSVDTIDLTRGRN